MESSNILGLDHSPPATFSGEKYITLYPDSKDYFSNTGTDIDTTHRMYHHYLTYGKNAGYSVNHTTIPIFYHIPRCAGTSLHYGTILPNLYNQYSIGNTNQLYNINFIQQKTGYNFFTIIGYPKINIDINHLINNITKYNNDMNINLCDMEYSEEILFFMQSNFNILSIIINSDGFIKADFYIKNLINSKNYDSYIVLRQPMSWHYSIFHYLRDIGNWEQTFIKYDKSMNFSDYIRSDLFLDNWLIKNLLGLSDKTVITQEQTNQCLEKLMQFTYVGLLEKFDEFLNKLYIRYNWLNLDASNNIRYNANIISNYKDLSHEDLSQEDFFCLTNLIKYENILYQSFMDNV